MTAQKLQMPGVQDRVGDDGGDGASAVAGGGFGGMHNPPREREDANGSAPAGAEGEQGRFGNHSGLASSGVQPLPLASRYVGTAKHDPQRPALSALGSSWIRRFLPSGGESGQDVSRGPKAVFGKGVGVSTSQPTPPFLLGSAPNKHHEQNEVGMGKGWMDVDSRGGEASVRVSGNGVYMQQKGKGPMERESRQETATDSPDWGENGVECAGQKAEPLPGHVQPPLRNHETVNSRLLLQKYEGGNRRTVLQSAGNELLANGSCRAVVRGFGSIRVPMKAPVHPPTSDYRVPGETYPKAKRMDGEIPMEADVPASATATGVQNDGGRMSMATWSLDRMPSGAQVAASSHTGTKFFTLPSKPKPLDDPRSGRPFTPVQFAGAWGFPRPKAQELERDPGGPPAVQPDGDRDIATGLAGRLKLGDPPGRFHSFGDGGFKRKTETGHEMGVERIKIGSCKNNEGFVSGSPPAHLGNSGRREDGGQAAESVFKSRPAAAAEEGIAGPKFGAGGVENRKMKGVVGSGSNSQRNAETGPSHSQQHQQHHHQQQLFPGVPAYGTHHPFQGDMGMGKVGHPLPFSPHSSFGEDNNPIEETRSSRGRAAADPAKPPALSTFFGAPRAYEDGLDGRGAQLEQHQQQAPWTSLFAAFKGHEVDQQAENSTSPSPTLPNDVHSRLQDGSMPANRPLEGVDANGVHESGGGGRGGNDVRRPASPEDRSRFDHQVQSSHFSSSPWPDETGPIPIEDTGSGPCNSRYQSQASRVANRNSGESKGKYSKPYMYDAGGEREGCESLARSRDSSGSEPDSRKGAGSQGEDEGQQVSNDGYQNAHGSSAPAHQDFAASPRSGYKDDTSDSAPPAYPAGYNSSEMASPMLPRGIIDEHLLSISGKLKNVEVDPEMNDERDARMARGFRKPDVGYLPKRPKHSDAAAPVFRQRDDAAPVFRQRDDASAFQSRFPDSQPSARPATETLDFDHDQGGRRGRPLNEGVVPGSRHGKRGEAMGEGGVSGSSKRTRHGSGDLGSQRAGGGAQAVPSSWLKRWLPPPATGTAPAAKPPPVFARPRDYPRNSLTSKPSRSNGTSNLTGGFLMDGSAPSRNAEEARRGKEVEKGHRLNGMKDICGKRGLNGQPPPEPVPSAAAMVLAGKATWTMGHFPQHRKGSISMWPSLYLHTAQAPTEGQRSSQNPEMPM